MVSSPRSFLPHRPRPAGYRPSRLTRLPAWAMLVVLALAAFAPTASGQTDPTQAKAQREEVRRQKAAVAAELDAAQATDAQLADALNAIDANVYAQEAVVTDARTAVADAERRIAELQTEMDQRQQEVDDLNTKLREQAIERYVNPEGRVDSANFLQSADFDEAENRRVLADAAGGNSRDTVDEIRATKVHLEDLQRETEDARQEAETKRQQEQAALDELSAARDEQARLKGEWDTRVANMTEEHDHLAAEEDQLSGIIAQAEAEQRAREEAARKAQEQAQAEAARARQLASAPATTSNSGGGSSGGGSAPAPSVPTTISGPVSGGGMIWPIAGRVSQEFGVNGHPGMDIFAPLGTPIYAAKAGTVISAGWNNGGYGNLVLIDHGGGIITAYAHQSQIVATVGQQVGQGTLIGMEGSTGNSTGPHLHFEVRVNGTAVNPRGYLP